MFLNLKNSNSTFFIFNSKFPTIDITNNNITNINNNNQNTITNASKDRLRAKIRTDELTQMQQDFEQNCKVDPVEMQQVST